MPAATELAASGKLRIEGDTNVSVLPGERWPLIVVYLDIDGQPVANKKVDFGLMGAPEGASLEAAGALTDGDGFATTTLVAGRTAPEFSVRVSADGVDPQYFQYFTINVGRATEPMLAVSLSYDGQRTIASNSLLVVEGMDCKQLRANATDARMSSSLALDETQTLRLGAGRSYAIAAWGSDATNSKVASGCREYTAPVMNGPRDANDETFSIALEDIAFTATMPIPLNFSIDVSQSLAALTPLSRSVVGAALPKTSTPEASFLLDALQSKVNLSATRSGLDAALQELLDRSSTGPLHYSDALAGAVAEEGATCLLQGSVMPMGGASNESTLTLSPAVSAVAAGSVAKGVSSSQVSLKLSEFIGRYDQARAEVRVESLKISLGFGSYAAYLVKAVAAQQQLYGERLAASTGCRELAQLMTARPTSFAGLSEMDASAACGSAINGLTTMIGDNLSALDAQRNTLSLSGSLAAHDRDGDKNIDDLGPANLDGSWAVAAAASAPAPETAIKANVRMSPVPVSARVVF